MEYCDAGSALDVLIQLRKPFSESQIRALMAQVIQGLTYLHKMSPPIIHRDIKSGNILLNSRGEVKLADFGVATQLSDTISKKQTQIGSPFWMAPEIIQESPYDTKVDIWSLGITAIELAQMKPPHWESGSIRALFLIATKPSPKLEEPKSWSAEFNAFVAACLAKNPKDRPSAIELGQHPFFQSEHHSHNCSPSNEDHNGSELLMSLVDECFLEESEKSDMEAEDESLMTYAYAESLKSGLRSAQRTALADLKLSFFITGEPREGELLTAQGEALNNSLHEFKFVWLRSPVEENEFIPIPGAVSSSPKYLVTKEDINCVLKCTCIATSPNISKSDAEIETSISALTEMIQPGKPQITRLQIEGGPYHTRLFNLKATYFGGDEGKSLIQWYRTSPDGKYEAIQGATKGSYQPSANDITCRFEVKYTPIRSDGVVGLPCYVVSKPVIKVVGRVLLYTISGVLACLHAKALLSQKMVPFVEIDLLKYPQRREEMQKLTNGKNTVPQIFFNRDHIGGMQELLRLEESGQLPQMIKQMSNKEPPDVPKLPTDEEAVSSPGARKRSANSMSFEGEKLFRIYQSMRDPARGLSVKVRGPITRRVRAFKGEELMKWIRVRLKVTAAEALKISQQLKDHNYFHRIKENRLPFTDDETLFLFESDVYEGYMLNVDQTAYSQTSSLTRGVRPASQVASDLCRQMLWMVERYAVVASGDAKSGTWKSRNVKINFTNVAASSEYYDFTRATQELQRTDLTSLKAEELTAFFINVHNALAVHANVVISVGLHKLPISESGMIDHLSWGSLGYIVNGLKYSLHDIKHGILRGNRKAPRRKVKGQLMSKHDPRAQYILTEFDPRIHFALVSGIAAHPAIGAYSGKDLDAELEMATQGFLQEFVEVEKSKKEITLPKLFYFFNKDFGKTDVSVLRWISDHLPPGEKRDDLEAVAKQKFKLTYQIEDQSESLVNLITGEGTILDEVIQVQSEDSNDRDRGSLEDSSSPAQTPEVPRRSKEGKK
eukprot:TRINITY_DN2442_c1_g1_i1.p1 TRINITY_DN2442_c1_g1~~TRINITY_DN2442_c1_g1_i1.p1  ORF type:complete len:1105 (+),score=306.42 TRINITY_DN2442_c1_g1_i1:300-3317(+)